MDLQVTSTSSGEYLDCWQHFIIIINIAINLFVKNFFFWPGHMAYGLLVPDQGSNLLSFLHWVAESQPLDHLREVLLCLRVFLVWSYNLGKFSEQEPLFHDIVIYMGFLIEYSWKLKYHFCYCKKPS